MAVKDYTGQLIKTANLYRPQAKPVIDLAGALSTYKDTYQNTRDRAMQEAQQNLQQTKQDALANALKGGDEKEIAAAYAEYNPQAAMAQRLEDSKLSQQFKNQMALLDRKYQNQRGLEALKQMYGGQGTGGNNMQNAFDTAVAGINQLQTVADDGDIGPWTRMRQKLNTSSDKQDQDLGRISSSISAIAPAVIQRLKNAGVSGVNTLGEFMTYVGLPENPTSAEIQGALPMIKQILGIGGTQPGGQSSANDDPLGIL